MVRALPHRTSMRGPGGRVRLCLQSVSKRVPATTRIAPPALLPLRAFAAGVSSLLAGSPTTAQKRPGWQRSVNIAVENPCFNPPAPHFNPPAPRFNPPLRHASSLEVVPPARLHGLRPRPGARVAVKGPGRRKALRGGDRTPLAMALNGRRTGGRPRNGTHAEQQTQRRRRHRTNRCRRTHALTHSRTHAGTKKKSDREGEGTAPLVFRSDSVRTRRAHPRRATLRLRAPRSAARAPAAPRPRRSSPGWSARS
jgi:hypothetical protein